MAAHDIEGVLKENSYFGRVSGITDDADISFSLDNSGVGRGISHIGGWLGITLVLQHADAGATSVGGVCVTFDVEAMSVIAEVPSLSV